jgi:hypothetical protein
VREAGQEKIWQRGESRDGQTRHALGAQEDPMKRAMASGLISASVAALSAVAGASPASAASAGPGWAIRSVALPSNLAAGDSEACEAHGLCDSYVVTVANVGAKPSTGTVVVKDALPAGVSVKAVERARDLEAKESLQCTNTTSSVRCEDPNPVLVGGTLAITIDVTVEPGAHGNVTNHAEVEGGGAAPVTTSEPSTVANLLNGEAPAFGLQDFSVGVYGANGASDSQAGDHPGALMTSIDYTTAFDATGRTGTRFVAVQDPKSEIVDLPLGFVGDPLAAEQCPESDLRGNHCPPGSQVGVAVVYKEGAPEPEKIYNMVPEAGYPALFAFEYVSADIFLRARVLPSASGYVLSVSVPEVPRSSGVKATGATVIFFGDPSERDGVQGSSQAFVTNPTNCSAGPSKARVEMDSWVNPSQWVSRETTMYEASPLQALSGCDALHFNPTIAVAPTETTQADTPSGYEVDLKVPQTANAWPELATPDLRNAEVTLPEGVSLSPGAADGLVGCKERGPEGIELGNHDSLGHEVQEGEELGPDELPHPAPGHCPEASKIGTVEVSTPLLANALKGSVYVAQPQCGGEGQPACTEASATDGTLYGLYLEAAGSGVIIKLKGTVSADPATGRLTTRFDENPQFPFSELKLKLKGESRAPLANPQSCGEAQTTSAFTPWSAPESGPPATPVSSFPVTGCQSPEPFAPAFSAGTLSPAAGAFTPFTLTFSRSDGQQDLAGIVVHTPPGLLGKIAEVPRCTEPQASEGTCSQASRIGTTTVAAGAGSHPFWLSGTVYLTGPYKGAPFGLSIVVPEKAGPFNLGNEVVRATINIDPYTSALTVVSDPLPQHKDGVPFRLKTVNVTIDRPDFMFNPTNCAAQHIGATITGALPNGAPGSSASVSSPFAAGGCNKLPFKPKLTALTEGRTSKAGGASLHVKVTSTPGQANIAKTALVFPIQLPSRLTTIQKACLAAVFEANPASCPEGSVIGTATVHTPVLASPLAGPGYLVSHGNAAFPDAEFVLQGEGITLILDGHTNIHKGITSSTFNSLPDAPFTSFDAVLPEGPHSAFAANGSFCSQTRTVTERKRVTRRVHGRLVHVLALVKVVLPASLPMPTTITGQNGAVIKQTTRIAVSGCQGVKGFKARKKHSKGKKGRHGKR